MKLMKTAYKTLLFSKFMKHLVITVVSRIYAPRFATLALVENVGGGLYAGSDILSCEYAPFSVATPRC